MSLGVMDGLLIHRVAPVYPAAAKEKHLKGDVALKVIIHPKGNVTEATALQGDPILAEAAIDAVKQWKYQPYLLNGEPIEVETRVVLHFPK